MPYTLKPSFSKPAMNLPHEQRSLFYAGQALAKQPWVRAPTTTDTRDGLGPLYNARSCLSCHKNGGRGVMPKNGSPLTQGVLRLSLSGSDAKWGGVFDPNYGDQIQRNSIDLVYQIPATNIGGMKARLKREAEILIYWEESNFSYPDGQKISLRRPRIEIRDMGYGPFPKTIRLSLRNAPPLLGMGLLANVRQEDIETGADPKDRDRDGISGRVNTTWDFEHERAAPGRFGLKANRANLTIQIAAALQGDMGISNPIFSAQPCTETQNECQRGPHGLDKEGYEISLTLFSMLVDYVRSFGVPARRQSRPEAVKHGEEYFVEVGCDRCHRPSYLTRTDSEHPYLSEQTIWPYTDLLLHDMGQSLSDGRSDYEATGREWRTAPLWGVGLSKQVNGSSAFLHDGRARTIEEAILWHDGEAASSRRAFTQLSPSERDDLLVFVRSL